MQFYGLGKHPPFVLVKKQNQNNQPKLNLKQYTRSKMMFIYFFLLYAQLGIKLLFRIIMFYKVQLICSHPPHQCRCRHNIATEVNQQDLTANLIKYNPSLLKYLGRPINRTQTVKDTSNEPNLKVQEEKEPYRSIVQEKGLNFIITDNRNSQNQPNHKKQPEQTIPKQEEKPIIIEQEKPISPKNNTKRVPQSKKQKQLKNYHKDLKNQSRYLSNTAFRKYFDRQCFQNYGNKNINDKADGFVYHNYLKTHNINPHSGQNIPINQQTFYHALVSASPEKYALQTQQLKNKPQQDSKHEFEKKKIDMQKMLEENLKHSKIEKKYQHIKLKSKAQSIKNDKTNSNRIKGVKSTQKIHGNTYNQSEMRHSPHQLNIQSKKIINPAPSSPKQKENQIRHTNPAQSIIIPQNTSRMQCGHKEIQSSNECECCLNQMKALILSMAESDPDLAMRMINSAKKATLYKNFALNNYETASMNPHNYRSDGKLNIYES